jgi:uncharacterized protein
MPVTAMPARWTPVPSSSRAVTLDALRGFALAGVLVANTLCFAYPQVSAPPGLAAMKGTGIGDRAALVLVALLVEGRFYSLLSVLFGAGLALQADRALTAGRPFAAFYLRRSAILLVIGALHGVLLYSADILAFYAIVAAAALAFRPLSARALARAAGVCGALAIVVLTMYAWTHPARPFPQPPDWNRLAAEVGGEAMPGAARAADARTTDFVARDMASVMEALGVPPAALAKIMEDEARTYREGSWLEITRHRAIAALLFATPSKVVFLGFYVLACFLLGMSLARRGWFVEVRDSDLARYRRLLLAGVPLGLCLIIAGSAWQGLAPRVTAAASGYWSGVMAGMLLQGLGYAGGIVLLCARWPESLVVRGLAAVGRTALSNYLFQSVVLGLVFDATGLGLFTRLTALPVVALAGPVFALEVWASLAWLRRFEMGPVEWAWRSIAYRRRLSLSKPRPVLAA